MSRRFYLFVVGMAAVGAGGCATPSRIVKQDAQQLVVAVPEDSDTFPYYYQSDATETARKHLSDPIRVAAMRVKVGETTTSNQSVDRVDNGGQSTGPQSRNSGSVFAASTSTKEDKFEYHIVYENRKPLFNVSPPPTRGPVAPGTPGAPGATGAPGMPAGPSGPALGNSPIQQIGATMPSRPTLPENPRIVPPVTLPTPGPGGTIPGGVGSFGGPNR